MNSLRERYLDIAKGYGIWCIILLHFENGFFPTWLNVFIGSHMISIFYFVTGVMMALKPSSRTPQQFFTHRFKQLGVPYLWWSAIFIVLDLLLWLFQYYDNYFIAREIFKTIVLRGIGTLWFLPALFFGEMAWCCVKNKKTWFIFLFLMLVLCYLWLYSYVFDGHQETIYRIIGTPFLSLYHICEASFYIACGYYFYRQFGRWLNRTKRWTLWIVGVGLMGIAYFTACHFPESFGESGPFVWKFFAPVIGPIALLILSKALENSIFVHFLEYGGKNSLCLMLTHYSLVLVFFKIMDEYVFNHNTYFGAYTLLYFAASIPCLYILTMLINSKFKFLLGK